MSAAAKVYVPQSLRAIHPTAHALASRCDTQEQVNEYLAAFGLSHLVREQRDSEHEWARKRDTEEVREWSRARSIPKAPTEGVSSRPVSPIGVRHRLRATFTITKQARL